MRIELGERSYDVVVGRNILDDLPHLLPPAPSKRGVIFADERLEQRAGRCAEILANAGWTAGVHCVHASEELKSFEGVAPLYDRLLADGIDREGTVFALGGGTIGDAVGYVAATFQRGMRWVGLPTTLVAQVDSAVGGKTAINHRSAKNIIGATHQPALVVCDVALLESLDERDRRSGLGEMLKYGLIADAALYRALLDGTLPLEEAVGACVAIKARYIEADEHDRRGVRAALNFGHTVAHAIEQSTGYGTFRHGEAVLLGMRAAVAISASRGRLDPAVAHEIDRELRAIPTPPLALDADTALAALRHDKKRMPDGSIRFVLLEAIGATTLEGGVDERTIRSALDMLAA